MKRQPLNKYYSVWKWSFLGWILPGVLCLGLAILIIPEAPKNPAVATVLALMSTLGIAAICFIGFGIQILSRMRVAKYIVAFCNYGNKKKPKPVAFRVHPNIKPNRRSSSLECPRCRAEVFVGGLTEPGYLIPDIEQAYRKEGVSVSGDSWLPITFVTLKKPGTAFATFQGAKRRCRGIQRGHWCEVEYDGGLEYPIALIKHELSHVILSKTFPMWSVGKQHRVMKKLLNV